MRFTHKPFQTDRSNVLHFMSSTEARWCIDLLKAVTSLAVPPSSGGGSGDGGSSDDANVPPQVLPASMVPQLTQAVSALDCMTTLAEHMRGARLDGAGAQVARSQDENASLRTEREDAMLGAVCALGRYVEATMGDVLKCAPPLPDTADTAGRA